MKAKTTVMSLSVCGVLLAALTAQALPDHDLHLNGHFRGTPQGYSPAPGWTLTPDGGNARILPGFKPGKFRLEITASPNRAQSVVSDLHQVFGNTIEIKADISGRGYASFGYEAFDQSGQQLIARENQSCTLSGGAAQKFKRYFNVTDQARYIRVRLTAERGSVAIFRDVEAEMKMVVAAPPPAPVVAAPPPAPVVAAPPPAPVVAAPPPAPVVAAPPPAAAVPPPPPEPVPAAPMIQHHFRYSWRSLHPVEHFQVQLPVGSEIEFKLEENRRRNLYWSVVSYDSRICRIKIDHDRDGVYPFRVDNAEFELKALWRGTTTVVLSCGEKKVVIHFTGI